MQESWVFNNLGNIALGKKKLGAAKTSSKSNRNIVCGGGSGLGLEFGKYKRGFGRKRVLVSDGQIRDASKVREETLSKSRKLEALPQDILVRVICGVEREDFKQLFNVSKTIREATLIAKKWHFEYTTPRKTLFIQNGLDSMIDLGGGIEAPLLKNTDFRGYVVTRKFLKSQWLFSNEYNNSPLVLLKTLQQKDWTRDAITESDFFKSFG